MIAKPLDRVPAGFTDGRAMPSIAHNDVSRTLSTISWI